MRSGLFGRTPLRFQDGTVISPIRRCILKWNMLWEWRTGTVGFSQILRLIPCEMCKWAPKDSAPVPRWNCHFVPFSDAFWMEYVARMEKRNCRFCGTFCVKCGSGQENIPVRFHDGAFIFSQSLIQSHGICGGNGEAELMVSHSCVVDSMWVMQVWSGIYCSGSTMEVSSSPNLRRILNGIRWWEWKTGTVGFSQFGSAFRAKDASGQRNIAADYACVEARENLTAFLCCICRKEGRLWREGQRAHFVFPFVCTAWGKKERWGFFWTSPSIQW
jgi:hypothetical protein